MAGRNPHEDDQPDAMNQGVHIALMEAWGYIECECGQLILPEDWAEHRESEGE